MQEGRFVVVGLSRKPYASAKTVVDVVRTAFRAAGRPCAAFVGHDLDQDNVELLRAGALSAVLHHDLNADMRRAIRQVLRHHSLLPGAPTSVPANVEVVTPYNLPARLLPD